MKDTNDILTGFLFVIGAIICAILYLLSLWRNVTPGALL